MAWIRGSLTNRVVNILQEEGQVVAGMVIDEQGSAHAKTATQADMLEMLREWNCPIILVEQNPPLRLHQGNEAPRATKRTIRELRLAAGDQFKRVIKGYFNAMVQTDLREKLEADGIQFVVIMGQQTNCCVRCTSIGARDIDKQEHDGLVQHGIRVLSTPGLMYSQFPHTDFLAHQLVEIYSDV